MPDIIPVVSRATLDRDDFLNGLREMESAAQATASRLASTPIRIPIQADDQVSSAIDGIISDNESKTITLKVDADSSGGTGGSGGGSGGGGFGGGGMGGLRGMFAARMAMRGIERLTKGVDELEATSDVDNLDPEDTARLGKENYKKALEVQNNFLRRWLSNTEEFAVAAAAAIGSGMTDTSDWWNTADSFDVDKNVEATKDMLDTAKRMAAGDKFRKEMPGIQKQLDEAQIHLDEAGGKKNDSDIKTAELQRRYQDDIDEAKKLRDLSSSLPQQVDPKTGHKIPGLEALQASKAAEQLENIAAQNLNLGLKEIQKEHVKGINDIIEKTRVDALKAVGDKAGAEKEAIRYKFEGTGLGADDTGGSIRDAANDPVKQAALKAQEQAELSGVQNKKSGKLEILSPTAAWKKMQELDGSTTPGSANLPGFAHAMTEDEAGTAAGKLTQHIGETNAAFAKRKEDAKSQYHATGTTAGTPAGSAGSHPVTTHPQAWQEWRKTHVNLPHDETRTHSANADKVAAAHAQALQANPHLVAHLTDSAAGKTVHASGITATATPELHGNASEIYRAQHAGPIPSSGSDTKSNSILDRWEKLAGTLESLFSGSPKVIIGTQG